ncbi:UvrD-helicase domain-containing protein [Bifidobacterium catenulatum]|uniref:DNA 3'-5' helicase n=1 Tax=Bifidobacterium catenulatum subsp. kashiwanohense TaxID=630129 RepID=A0AA43P8B5_9BIFI|nr:UvrD-helicase domain-containing protein [Bifidobacterium catenulatum]MDH7890759.1 UvrD-helicase domain-containing protein [Bifidobacterium catenulatum subsp. kashiwanohense]
MQNIIGKIEKHDLSDEQISAIAGAGHNTLVLAGAGTGKTTTIIGYIAWLLATKRAAPEEILVLSFTKASAGDMSQRIMASTGKTIRACTFHSLGLEICRAATIANRPIIDGHTSNTVVRNTFEQLLSKNIGYRLLAFKLMSKELLGKYGKAAKSEDFQLPTDDYGFNQYKQNLIENAQTIIQHMRQNSIGIDGMRELNERSGGKNVGRNREMLQLIEPLYNAYISNFRTTHGIDFPGMITDAIRCIQRGAYRHPYKYVLIDEYQDMSRPRYELIRALRLQHDFSLFCVGDDWQSIYRFAGSDIHLILDFDRIWRAWGPTRMFQITTTRRFRQSLIDASGAFVMRDTNLYVKHLNNPSDKKDYSLKALGGHTEEERFNVIVEQLRKLPKTASVLLLGRYRSDINLMIRCDQSGLFSIDQSTGNIRFLEKPDMDIRFMTAHASKGLQRDFVFLLCCSGGLKGFPSTIPEEPLLGLLLPEVERMPHAEERRLFYVAMTRCRKKLFFVVDQSRPSRFMYELHDRICPNIFRGVKLPPQCPNCGEALRLRHAGSDPSRKFYGCIGFPNCRYTQQCK